MAGSLNSSITELAPFLVPASSPESVVENLGGLDLIRISPRCPAGTH